MTDLTWRAEFCQGIDRLGRIVTEPVGWLLDELDFLASARKPSGMSGKSTAWSVNQVSLCGRDS